MTTATRSYTLPPPPVPVASEPSPARAVFVAVAVITAGAALGVLTVMGQDWFEGPWLAVVNSGAVWLAPAFAAGACCRTDLGAGAAGTALLVTAVIAYYGSIPFLTHGAWSNPRSVGIWIAVSLVGGPAYGVAGRWWARSRSWKAWVGLGLLGGAFLAEGLSRLRVTNDTKAGAAMVLVGLFLPLVLGRSGRERISALLVEVPVLAATAFAYAVINAAFLQGLGAP